MKHVHHPHHAALTYPKTLPERIYALFVAPLGLALLIYVAVSVFQITPHRIGDVSFWTLFVAALFTLGRLLIAYVIAVILAVPLALLATSNRVVESVLLPFFDVLDSIPILAFFPVVILLFIRVNFLEGAAIFILFVNILWNIVFTVVGGLKLIPKDIGYAARVFGLGGLSYFRRLLLPAIFPQLVTGSILALAQGWNLIIVAEALHTYIPEGAQSQDLFGIGSVLVHAAAGGENNLFIAALVTMILFIAFINLFVWQRLLRISQRYRFD